MVLYSPHITPRVLYMAHWAGNYLFGSPFIVKDSISDSGDGECIINYSTESLPITAYQVVPAGLLFEGTIRFQAISVKEENGLPSFFLSAGQHPFDIFSAVFYLITRYEEYLPHEKDAYGRYAHNNSLAYTSGFLNRPLVDEWMEDLKQRLHTFFPGTRFVERSSRFLPTYDVDMAWSYLNKGRIRNLGGLLREIATGRWSMASGRVNALRRKTSDPFDVFAELDALHEKYNLHPVYFFLLARKRKGYDKNISPANPAFQQLIRTIAGRYQTGIHLGWQAWQDESLMTSEKEALEKITGQAVDANRMHYIKFDLPRTYQQLCSLGIREEYSMGYGSINGFRASTCSAYQWYDLSKEAPTNLSILPFCYMEANSIFEQKDSPEAALAELHHYYNLVKEVKGTMITIFHNHLIGSSKEGQNWWQVYENFLAAM